MSFFDQDVQIIIEDFVEEFDFIFVEGRYIFENIFRLFVQFKQVQNGSVGNRFFQVGIFEIVVGFSQ